MPRSAVKQALIDYARQVREDLRAATAPGDGPVIELMLHDRFRALLEALLPAVFPSAGPTTLPRVLVEYTRRTIGRPDIALARPGEFAKSFIELKPPGNRLDPRRISGHDKEQFDRFCNLPTWAYSNFHEIHLYRRNRIEAEARLVPARAIDPTTSDTRAAALVDGHDTSTFEQIVEALTLAQPPTPRTATEVAISIAHAARLIRGVVFDLARQLEPPGSTPPDALFSVREEFRDVLYARPSAGGHGTEDDFNELFAIAFAQTLAYGLLLAREARAAPVDSTAFTLISSTLHPLLRVTLQALLLPQITDDLGGALQVLLDSVNAVDPALLRKSGAVDPILYFYEDFLSVFDKKAKEKFGVFYTPVEVVNYQVHAADDVLRNRLGTDGLLDSAVHVLDPACGTGTYLVATAAAAATRARAEIGGAAVPAELRSLASRIYGLEILVGPYAVAHYRLHRELSEVGATLRGRLNVYLADTLSPATGTASITPHLAFMSAPIVEERRLADEVKSTTPILAIIGNPPYRRLAEGETAELVGSWVADTLWRDFKEPVRNAGWGGELNTFPDLYIAFYRWALWKLFERPGADGRGVLCFITNRTFLTGHPFAGLRQVLRQRFNEIRIVDLRGDTRGARPAGIERDECVFNIEAGVCILTAYADRSKPADHLADVYYADIWEHGHFDKEEKLRFLADCSAGRSRLNYIHIQRSALDDFRPRPFEGKNWPSIADIFLERTNGIQSKRDAFIYDVTQENLSMRIEEFLSSRNLDQCREAFHETRDRKIGEAKRTIFNSSNIELVSYRPLDRKYIYNKREFIDFPRTALHRIWGDENVCIYTLPGGIGKGPSIFVHGNKPDYHSFRGCYGGYAFPLYDRRPGSHPYNVNESLVSGLSGQYTTSVTPPEIFDYLVSVLSAASYTRRFASDLQDTFPHVPFPRDVALFRSAASIGARIRELESFQAVPHTRFRTARIEGSPVDFSIQLPALRRCFLETTGGMGHLRLKADGSLRVDNVPGSVWNFGVSGYRVLYRWLDARNHLELDHHLQRELLDLVARIAELLELFNSADAILPAILGDTLSVAELGLPA